MMIASDFENVDVMLLSWAIRTVPAQAYLPPAEASVSAPCSGPGLFGYWENTVRATKKWFPPWRFFFVATVLMTSFLKPTRTEQAHTITRQSQTDALLAVIICPP